MGTNNSYPDLRLGSTNGNNIGIATTAGSFSGSAAVNDRVIRSINRLLLQSGGAGHAMLIDSSNNISCGGTLNVASSTTLNNSTTCISSLNVSGITTLSNSVFINSATLNNWLFNSNGTNHEALNNFSSITKFGYTFINGGASAPLNGPGTGDTQYYSWHIGLGADYPAIGNVGSYGMQFAIGRNDTNPKLCIRRNQNNSWTAWQGITAEQAITATTATTATTPISGDFYPNPR
jgi:hypothetical protein